MSNWITPIIVIFISNIANIASVGCKIVLEKDWIVIIADGDDNKLAMMNAVFRTIDLVALVISPAVAGIIFDFINEVTTAVVIGTWNIVSVFMEYYLLVLIYQDFPDLSKPKLTELRYVLLLSSFHVIVNYTFF